MYFDWGQNTIGRILLFDFVADERFKMLVIRRAAYASLLLFDAENFNLLRFSKLRWRTKALIWTLIVNQLREAPCHAACGDEVGFVSHLFFVAKVEFRVDIRTFLACLFDFAMFGRTPALGDANPWLCQCYSCTACTMHPSLPTFAFIVLISFTFSLRIKRLMGAIRPLQDMADYNSLAFVVSVFWK